MGNQGATGSAELGEKGESAKEKTYGLIYSICTGRPRGRDTYIYTHTADLLGFTCTAISRIYREWSKKEKISSEWQFCGQKCLVDARG